MNYTKFISDNVREILGAVIIGDVADSDLKMLVEKGMLAATTDLSEIGNVKLL